MQSTTDHSPTNDGRGHNSGQLRSVPVSAMKVRPTEPRVYSDADAERAAAVLDQLPLGVPVPVVLNESLEVLVGGIFLAAARKRGLEQLIVVVQAGLTDIQQKQYAIAVNQLLSRGEWDPKALEAWIRDLEGGLEDFSHLTLGFENGELDQILGLGTEITSASAEADAVPTVQAVAVSQAGMLWVAGQHRVMVGDATKQDDLDLIVGGSTAKMVITDPPFGCPVDGFVSKKGRHRNFVQGAGEMSKEQLAEFFENFMRNLHRHLLKGALVYIFIDWRSLDLLMVAGGHVFGPIIQLCCWSKDRAGMGGLYRSQHELVLVFRAPGAPHANNVQLGKHGRNRSNVWNYPCAASSRSGREGDMLQLHPTPKSVEMIADAILDCTEHGDRVLDCFLGSGTTLIAAERTGRICHGMDLDPLYVDVAIRRWQAWTGLSAVDAGSGRTFDEIANETRGGESNV